VPLDPISVGAYKGGYALLDPSAVGRHALGCKGLDPGSGRFHAASQQLGESNPFSLRQLIAITQEAQTDGTVGR
jgi:hypothetical protein